MNTWCINAVLSVTYHVVNCTIWSTQQDIWSLSLVDFFAQNDERFYGLDAATRIVIKIIQNWLQVIAYYVVNNSLYVLITDYCRLLMLAR